MGGLLGGGAGAAGGEAAGSSAGEAAASNAAASAASNAAANQAASNAAASQVPVSAGSTSLPSTTFDPSAGSDQMVSSMKPESGTSSANVGTTSRDPSQGYDVKGALSKLSSVRGQPVNLGSQSINMNTLQQGEPSGSGNAYQDLMQYLQSQGKT